MIVVLAGRRIDAKKTQTSRFPLKNRDKVRDCIREKLIEHQATALVCSGACGADLLALEVAGKLGLKRRMVLPFDSNRFRETSVTDRPGDWGYLFDKIVSDVEAIGDLVNLKRTDEGEAAFTATNEVIFQEALALAQSNFDRDSPNILALIVWDKKPKDEQDITAFFKQRAENSGFLIDEIATNENKL